MRFDISALEVSLDSPTDPVFGSLLWRPTLRSRDGVLYATCRMWRRSARGRDLAEFKDLKARMPEGPIAHIAAELARVASQLLGAFAGSAVPVTCGHSRRLDCLSFRLAHGVAKAAGLDFSPAFKPRFMKGSSHPRENVKLPPLEFQSGDLPRPLALVVDDVATTGFHIVEAVNALREKGVAAAGLVWIGGISED